MLLLLLSYCQQKEIVINTETKQSGRRRRNKKLPTPRVTHEVFLFSKTEVVPCVDFPICVFLLAEALKHGLHLQDSSSCPSGWVHHLSYDFYSTRPLEAKSQVVPRVTTEIICSMAQLSHIATSFLRTSSHM